MKEKLNVTRHQIIYAKNHSLISQKKLNVIENSYCESSSEISCKADCKRFYLIREYSDDTVLQLYLS